MELTNIWNRYNKVNHTPEMLDDYLGEMKNCRAQLIQIANRGNIFWALFLLLFFACLFCLFGGFLGFFLVVSVLTSLIFLEVLGYETSWESSVDQEGGSCCQVSISTAY